MLGLVLSALRARRTQTVAIFALTVLAALGASAAPWFMAWAHDAVAAADIRAAPASQRVIVAGGSAQLIVGDPSPLPAFRATVAAVLDVEGAVVTTGAKLYANLAKVVGSTSTPVGAGLYLGTRSGICDQVRVVGACPDQPGEVMISRGTAEAAAVELGDTLNVDAFRVKGLQHLTVSGIYEIKDVLSAYWAGTALLNGTIGEVATRLEDAAFVSEQTLFALPLDGVDLDYHLQLPDVAFADGGATVRALMTRATDELRRSNIDVRSSVPRLVEQIGDDQRLVATGVQVAALELVLLAWFALYLAVRQTSDSRRADIGLLKLRGSSPWRIWVLTAQQSAIPMLLGVIVGGLLGYASALVLAGQGTIRPSAGTGLTLLASLAAAIGVGVGSLLAATAAEFAVLRSPVTALLRRVPTRRPGWRGNIGDIVIAGLAVAGLYQGYVERDAASGSSVLSLLAPGLFALAVALLMARVLPWLALKIGVSALRAGRSGAALSALNVARRPGTDRVFIVLAVCVGVVGASVFSWQGARTSWTERAELELGAPRVLVVRADNSTQLLNAVRSADPDGRYAMAVAVNPNVRGTEAALAVDVARLRRVAYLPERYGLPAGLDLAGALHPDVPGLPAVHDGPLTLDLTDDDPPVAAAGDEEPTYPLTVRITLESTDGAWHLVATEPLAAGRHAYQVGVSGCVGGCRLVGFELITRRDTATLVLHEVSQGATPIVTAAQFGDIARWHPPIGAGVVGPGLRADARGLTVTRYNGPTPNNLRADQRVLVADAPAPLPVLLAGGRPPATRPGDSRIAVVGGERVPYRDIGGARLLPRLGAGGGLVDLELAHRISGRFDETTSLEVWLTADAPPEVIDRITAAGIAVITDTTVRDAVDRIASHGPGAANRFLLFAALILLLLAGGVVVLAATVQRRDRSQELRSLRHQGLPEASMRFAGHAATLLVVVGAIVTGLLAALIAHSLVAAALPVFTDSWTLLPGPSGVPIAGLVLAALTTVAVLVPAGVVASARVVRSVGSPRPGEG